MDDNGLGPKADKTREELDSDLRVRVEVIGENPDTGAAVIHDPEYLEPPGESMEMTLAEAREKGAMFCCDCFETAWIEMLDDRADSPE